MLRFFCSGWWYHYGLTKQKDRQKVIDHLRLMKWKSLDLTRAFLISWLCHTFQPSFLPIHNIIFSRVVQDTSSNPPFLSCIVLFPPLSPCQNNARSSQSATQIMGSITFPGFFPVFLVLRYSSTWYRCQDPTTQYNITSFQITFHQGNGVASMNKPLQQRQLTCHWMISVSFEIATFKGSWKVALLGNCRAMWDGTWRSSTRFV